MPDDDASQRGDRAPATVTFRVTEEEFALLRRLRERLQERAEPRTRITDKRTFLEALDALQMRLDDLDRKRKR